MKNLFLLTFIVINLIKVSGQTCKEIIGYYPNWQWYDRGSLVKPKTIAYKKYTIINYCFFKPEVTGLISNTDAWADENLLLGQINSSTTPVTYYPNTSIIDLAHNAGTKVMVSIGGWTFSNNFSVIAASSSKRALFASECNRLLKFYKFDGIDLDWEYPGYAPHSGTTDDKHNFTLLIQEIKDSITSLGNQLSKSYKLSACFGAEPDKASNIEWNKVVPKLDMINLMAYYYFGPWDCYANHHSPLQRSSFGDQNFNINSSFNMLTTTYQVPANKINIGMCFHGRTQTGANNIFQSTNCGEDKNNFALDGGAPTYYNILDKYNLFDYNWDNTAQVPYLVGKTGSSAQGTFVSFDNKRSIGIKAQYINDNNARGAILWELTGDYIESAVGSGVISETPLLDTLNYIFCKTTDIKSNQKMEFDLYPNPANDYIGIDINEQTLNTLNIFDSKGSLVLTQSVHSGYNEINLKQLSQGIYVIRLQSKEFSYFKKVIKL